MWWWLLVKIAVAAQKSWTNRNYPRFHSYYKDLFYFSLSFPSRTKICLLLLDQSFSLLALRQDNMIWCIILRELPLVESVVPSLMAPLLPLMWSRLVLFRVSSITTGFGMFGVWFDLNVLVRIARNHFQREHNLLVHRHIAKTRHLILYILFRGFVWSNLFMAVIFKFTDSCATWSN